MALEFDISEVFAATPQAIYQAWLSSEEHSLMTRSPAQASDQVGGSFSSWDGYIFGRNLELEPGKRIVQAWRTTEFLPSDPDSLLDIRLEPVSGGTLVAIHHSNLPADGMQYKQGWIDYYFQPMLAYFLERTGSEGAGG
jgi:activator of HSP90 ATPase